MRNHLFFLSTDKYASPFDINIALDAGYDAVIPYTCVKQDEAVGLAQDIIFSRGPKGAAHCAIFVGGSDIALAEKIARLLADSMQEPFVSSIFVDPRGAYTTSSALVAKILKGSGTLAGKKVVIFGGTGPVGRSAGVLFAREGALVTIVTSRGVKHAQATARLARTEHGVEMDSASAPDENARVELAKNADICVSAVKAGVETISFDAVKRIGQGKIIADVNAVAPYGFGGLFPADDMRQVAPGVMGVGPLAIGALKYKVEKSIFKSMIGNGIFAGFEATYERAKTLA